MPATTRLAAVGAVLFAAGSALAVTPCFTQNFAGIDNLGGFDGGSESYTNPGAGGVGGAADGFLIVGNSKAAFLGARNTTEDFAGDFLDAGVVRLSFWLNHVSGDALEMHLIVGLAFGNAWQLNTPFVPTTGEWRKFSAVLSTDEADWTQVVGSGTLEDALRNGDRIAFRHDEAPYTQFPEAVVAELGIDNVRIIAGACDCAADVNDDGVVDFADLNFVLSDYNRSGAGFPGDVNFDGSVTFDDLNIVLGFYNLGCP